MFAVSPDGGLLRIKKRDDTLPNCHEVPQLALPERQNTPPQTLEFRALDAITLHIAADLLAPIRSVRLGDACASRAVVAVPETPMHEDDLASRNEYQIGGAGKVPTVKAEAVPKAMNQGTDAHLW